MDEIIFLIENKLTETTKLLSANPENKKLLVEKKIELEDMLYLIELYKKYDLKRKNILDVFSVPQQNTGYSEFRIMDDCETEHREYWQELDVEKRLYPNDVVIKLK